MALKPRLASHRDALRWISKAFRRSIERGSAARRQVNQLSDDDVMDLAPVIAKGLRGQVQDFRPRTRAAISDRALLLDVAEEPAEARKLLVELAAIGARIEVER